MFNTGNCSVPLVASIDGNGNNGNGFGDGGWAWWIIILLIFGWGGNGFGFGGNGGANSPGLQGLATRADINEGFALNNLQSGINALQQGICDSTYALNNAITNGFNNTNMGMMQGFNGVNVASVIFLHSWLSAAVITEKQFHKFVTTLQLRLATQET